MYFTLVTRDLPAVRQAGIVFCQERFMRISSEKSETLDIFCKFHPFSMLEQRLVDSGCMTWYCPECEKEHYIRERLPGMED